MDKKIVFMGSPDFAVPSLRLLHKEYIVCGVVTQPDRRAGRGRGLKPPPVKAAALELGLPVIQPERLKNEEAYSQLVEWAPDLIVVAAYGQILRKNVLELPEFGCINVHASLLPRWRGASPIQAAIAHGDQQTGVSIMQMEAGLDTGPVLSQKAIDILPSEKAGDLEERLSILGAELLLETLPGWFQKKIQPCAQDDSQLTYAPLMKKEDGKLDLSQSAEELERKIRAYNPWPGCYIEYEETNLKIHSAHVLSDPTAVCGERDILNGFPVLGTSAGWLVLDFVQPAGKTIMDGKVFLNGARNWKQDTE